MECPIAEWRSSVRDDQGRKRRLREHEVEGSRVVTSSISNHTTAVTDHIWTCICGYLYIGDLASLSLSNHTMARTVRRHVVHLVNTYESSLPSAGWVSIIHQGPGFGHLHTWLWKVTVPSNQIPLYPFILYDQILSQQNCLQFDQLVGDAEWVQKNKSVIEVKHSPDNLRYPTGYGAVKRVMAPGGVYRVKITWKGNRHHWNNAFGITRPMPYDDDDLKPNQIISQPLTLSRNLHPTPQRAGGILHTVYPTHWRKGSIINAVLWCDYVNSAELFKGVDHSTTQNLRDLLDDGYLDQNGLAILQLDLRDRRNGTLGIIDAKYQCIKTLADHLIDEFVWVGVLVCTRVGGVSLGIEEFSY